MASKLVSMAVPLVLWQTSIVCCLGILTPALPLLLSGAPWARRAFLRWAGHLEAAWLAMAIALLQYALGIRILLHTPAVPGEAPEVTFSALRQLGPSLVVSNHRTRLDWMFLWSLDAALGRFGGLKIVLKDTLRSVPGFGWACQCFGFAFMRRGSREADLATLRDAVTLHVDAGERLALVLFPEGTDLSTENIDLSNDFADAKGLPHYEHVLHPKTAGFAAAWQELASRCAATNTAPVLVDVTLGYKDFEPGERPSEVSVFYAGRACQEVHIYVEVVAAPPPPQLEACEAFCRALFAQKESKLAAFYAPCAANAGQPQVSALAGAGSHAASSSGSSSAPRALLSRPLAQLPGVPTAVAWGCACVALVEGGWLALFWRFGSLRSLVLLGCSWALFAAITRATGGVDQVLLRHLRAAGPAVEKKGDAADGWRPEERRVRQRRE